MIVFPPPRTRREGGTPGNKEGKRDGGVKDEWQTPAGGDELGDPTLGHPIPFISDRRPRGVRSPGEEVGGG